MRFRKTLTFFILATALVLALPAMPQQKPFTREQVVSMVRDGFGDESGAKLIEQRGIDFAPAEDFIQTLKAAGASEAFLKALRAAKPPEPANARKPINQVQVFALLVGQVSSHRVSVLVQERGIDFDPTDDYLQEIRLAGGENELMSALRSAKVTRPTTVDPAAQARQTEVRQHMARGAEFDRQGQYVKAESEIRAALLLDSQNSDLYASLAYVLSKLKRWNDAESAGREALRLNPKNDVAHHNISVLLGNKGDMDGAITEEREALRLNPDNDLAHYNLGVLLGNKHDIDGAIVEFGEAVRLNPNNEDAHVNLGALLGSKGDLDGAMAQFHEALSLNPNNDAAHIGLGSALGRKGDQDGAIAEFREALRLNPGDDTAHADLGAALGIKGDLDGAIAEEREALRLNGNNDTAHFCLGLTLEEKGDRGGALDEYRAAYMLDPKNAAYKQNYERLLQQVNR
jgi:tetratricopeptide (TPR) repeat protein